MYQASLPTTAVYISADSQGVTRVFWHECDAAYETPTGNTHAMAAVDTIQAYTDDKAPIEMPKLNLKGTPFQKKVWEAIAAIPFGEVRSYSEIAEAVNSHPRAVAGACGKNPAPILVPCHRVVAKGGSIGGYSGAGGLDMKRALLAHEGIIL